MHVCSIAYSVTRPACLCFTYVVTKFRKVLALFVKHVCMFPFLWICCPEASLASSKAALHLLLHALASGFLHPSLWCSLWPRSWPDFTFEPPLDFPVHWQYFLARPWACCKDLAFLRFSLCVRYLQHSSRPSSGTNNLACVSMLASHMWLCSWLAENCLSSVLLGSSHLCFQPVFLSFTVLCLPLPCIYLEKSLC